MSKAMKFAYQNTGTGLSWKGGPPYPSQAADARSLGGMGNYMPLPRAGAPEPLGCSGGCASTLEIYRPRPSCGCESGIGAGFLEEVLEAAVTGLVVVGALAVFKSLFKGG